jgi:hypothetical protein
MKIKAWTSRLKQLALKLLDLIATSSMPVHKDKDDDWWRYYTGFFE